MNKAIKLTLFYLFTAITIFIAIVPLGTYVFFAKDLKSKDTIMNRNNTGVTLLDRNDRPFFMLFQAKNKIFVPLSEIPQYVQQVIIVSEDRGFYSHPGFSVKSILRSIYLDIKEGSTAYGGSTITQQLVKNSLLSSNKSFLRKYQELVLSQEIERRFSKQEILEMYLNSVYFGEGAFGIEEASKTYFNKSVKDITLGEAAFLVSLLPSPSKFSPFSGDPSEAFERKKNILQQMVKENYISLKEKDIAEKDNLKFVTNENQFNTIGIHFAMMVKDKLIQQFGEEEISRSGFVVKTTLDLDWQLFAEKAVKDQVEYLRNSLVSNGSAVVIDPKTGEVKALVGSVNWFDDSFGKVNVATSLRQPGSSFKPIVYSAAFEQGLITPATILHDVPTTFPVNYRPTDFDGRFRGNVTVRRALANSLNIPAVEVMSKIGVENALSMAKRLGVTTLNDSSRYGLSLALGAGETKLLELTNVYATFANQGVKNEITLISEINDKYGQKIYSYQPTSQKVLDPGFAYLISSILADNAARAEQLGNTLTISRPAAVKTGTSENFRDSLTIGYTPSLAVGVWVGNNDNSPMTMIAGSLGAAPIWKNLMEQFLSETPVEEFVQPENIVKGTACNFANSTNGASGAAYPEYYIAGTDTNFICPITPTPLPTTPPILTLTPTVSPALPVTPPSTLIPSLPVTTTPFSPTPTKTIIQSFLNKQQAFWSNSSSLDQKHRRR